MQVVTGDRTVTTGGVEASTSFGFKPEHLKYVKKILRDSIYSDKVLAVIREYSANAWDAHNMNGKGHVPIMVRVPTQDDPRLLIEDYGPGMSHEDVFGRFAFYGDSSKRETNDGVGMLGIGCKCGLCYSDTIVITSRHGGMKRTYVAKLTSDGDDSLDLLSTTPWDGESGMTIQIAVKPKDIAEFEHKACDLFKYFNPRPDININLPAVPRIRSKLKHGLIYDQGQYGHEDAKSGKWLALMGCIPYNVAFDQLVDMEGKSTIANIFKSSAGILDFDVGAVQISSSRESLEYSETTKAALTQKFADLLDEYTKYVLDEVERGDISGWERRIKAQKLLHLGLTQKEIGDWAENRFILKPKTFRLSRPIDVLPDTKLIRRIIPEGKDLRGYHLYGNNRVLIEPTMISEYNETSESWVTVQPSQEYTWEEIDAELSGLLHINKLDGIPFANLADMDWQPPYVRKSKSRSTRASGPKDSKHVKRVFKLVDTSNHRGKKYSENWEVLDHAPRPEDVYVIITEFLPEEMRENFYDLRKQDEALAKACGVKLPEVYGYKSTDARPVDRSKIAGTAYTTWRNQWRKALASSEEVTLAREFFAWRESPSPHLRGKPEYTELVMSNLVKEFGEDHDVVVYLKNALWARETVAEDMQTWRAKVSALDNEGLWGPLGASSPQSFLRRIYARYPLIKDEALTILWGRMSALHYRQYIRCIDKETKSEVPPQLEFNI
jgi:hypothetical protein